MNAPPLLQPPLPPGTLDRFASATVDLLGADGAATLEDHLRSLAALTGTDLVLLYRGGAGGRGFDLVASFGVPREAMPALRHIGAAEPGTADPGTGRDTPALDKLAPVPDKLAPALGELAKPLGKLAPPLGELAPAFGELGIRARWDEPLRADGDRVGRLVFGSRRWDAFHPGTLTLFAATAAQIAVILQHRLSEQGDAEAASSPDIVPPAGAEPLLFRRRRDRFIALLAHELRNPVAPIQSGLDLLATDRLDAAARHDTVQMMRRQLAQLTHLIDDFLDSARLNSGRLRAQRKPMQLLPALGMAIESIEPAARAKRQRIERAGWEAAREVVVDADPVRLTQAFTNLLAAGASATPPAGTLTVRLLVDADAGIATIAFEDQGPPIAEDPGDGLVDLFAAAAAKTGEHGGGFGAGLGLVRGLLALNDGCVVARNQDDGSGRVFAVTLPVAARPLDVRAGAPVAPALGARRVLVVDDNRDAAESLGLLFRLDGHTVRLAHDGPTAVAAAAEFEPELVLMDLGLPGFSGHEAIERIRGAEGPVRPAIVALTGWGTRADRDASARAGADLHLVKPVAQAQLNAAIQALLQPGRPLVPAQ